MPQNVLSQLFNFQFSSHHNTLYGIFIVIFIFGVSFKAIKAFKETHQEKFIFLASMFFIAGMFEFLHFIVIFNNHYIEFLNVFFNRLFECIGLLGILFIHKTLPNEKINTQKHIVYASSFLMILAIEYFLSKWSGTPNIFPELLNIITSFIFISLLSGFTVTKLLNKESPLNACNAGIFLLAVSSFYVIDTDYYTSFYRHLIHILKIAGNLFIFLGFNDFKQEFHKYSLRLKLILLPNIYMIVFYILFILFGNFLFDLNISDTIYTAFLAFYSLCLIAQSILVTKLTEPLTQIKEGLAKIAPGEKPIPIKLGENDEISILADNINRVWQTQWKYTQEINKKQIQIKELMHNRDAFIAALSHDLKSPIFAEQKLIEATLMDREKLQENCPIEYLEDIYQINEELLRIINNLLASHHLESEQFRIEKEDTDINNIIINTAKTLKYLAKDENIEINLNLSKNLPLIPMDKDLISRVITNLISNSIKHSKSSTQIEINTKKENDYIEVSIKDNGLGIPEEEKANIFKKYPGNKRKVGTGLGLYISKQIITAHEGEIWFESRKNKGTTFYFKLPKKSQTEI